MSDAGGGTETAEALMEDHLNLLGDLVRHRILHGLSQAGIAERMGVTLPYVVAFEMHDANPTLAEVRRYARAVGVRLHTRVIDDCEDARRR